MKPKILTTMTEYSWTTFRSDLLAGATVAMVALPLSLAIAIASGAPPEKGLVTAIVAGLLISLLGGSRVQIGGPTGAFIVVVFGVIAEHGYDGLVLATFMAGGLLLLAGALRAGTLIGYVPEAVIHGFTIGIAGIIAASQLKDFLGLPPEGGSAGFLGDVAGALGALDQANLAALGVALGAMAAILLLRRLFPRWPGLIVAVGAASAVVAIGALPVETIGSRFGALPARLPWPAAPEIGLDRVIELLPSAFVIAFLAGVESLLSAMVADRMIEGHHRPNAEMLAQGAANIGSALFGGLPATGAIARTATNIRAGGRTPVAGVVHALTLLALLMLAAPLAGHLALPALAALLILTAWNMSEPGRWRAYRALPREDGFLLLLTMALTLLTDLTIAIGVGVAIGLALRLRRHRAAPDRWDPPTR